MVLFTPMSGRLPNDIDMQDIVLLAILLYWRNAANAYGTAVAILYREEACRKWSRPFSARPHASK